MRTKYKIKSKFPEALDFFLQLMLGLSMVAVFVATFSLASSITNLFGGILVNGMIFLISLKLPSVMLKE